MPARPVKKLSPRAPGRREEGSADRSAEAEDLRTGSRAAVMRAMRPTRRSFLMLPTVLATAAVGCRKKRPELLYVSAEASGELVILDPARAEVLTRVAVGKRPRGIKISSDGKLLYVALSGSPRGGPNVDESKLPPGDRSADGIGVVDLETQKLLRTLPSGQDPETFDLSADGKTLFISNEETSELSALDLVAGKVKGHAVVGAEPEGVTVRPDGKVVYVTSEAESAVSAVDTATLAVLGRVSTGPRPRNTIFTPDGKLAFVNNEFGSSISVIDAQKHALVTTIKLESKTEATLRPMGGVLSADARKLFVSTGRGGSIVIIDVAAQSVSGSIPDVGARPWGIAISPDGKRLYTANGPSDDISIIDVQSAKVERRIKVGGLPWGIAAGRAD
jgi:YVTN family beta-propeller protein